MVSRVLAIVAVAYFAAPGAAAGAISERPSAGYFQLVHQKTAADIFVDKEDWTVAQTAAGDLALDVERVTCRRTAPKHTTAGLSSEAVLVGTIGRSPVLDRLIDSGRLM
ncbi:MAG TPA: hypothetical protein VFJ58_23155 [Armatimonadota bacterium]|nr:hypothetical protein [Armatimonadota bacterium]